MPAWDQLTARTTHFCPAGGWRPSAISEAIGQVLSGSQIDAQRDLLGRSFEGRPIELVTIGAGPRRALMWSQMHGDEPTHTTALVNLLAMLVAADPAVERILRGLTLGIITPLNPDGAERNTRRNAQGIDINRDFKAFATSEARALRKAFGSFEPDYALNLHNQSHRRAMPDEPRRPASLSLQAPPIDHADTLTESVRESHRVAAALARIGADRCEGRVSRYPADYMPRASGDWAQSQGVPTVLVEAGGWPRNDFRALERFHTALLGQTLDAIAASALGEPGGLESYDPQRYLGLPRSSPRELFDLVFRVAGLGQLGDEPSVGAAEVGVDFPDLTNSNPWPTGGVINGVGDLAEQGGVEVVSTQAIVAPGRIVIADPTTNHATLIAAGATTALTPVDLADEDLLNHGTRAAATESPVRRLPVVCCGSPDGLSDATLLGRLATAAGAGAVATLGELPPPIVEACCRLGLPALDPESTPVAAAPLPKSIEAWIKEVAQVSSALGWDHRGRIDHRADADLVLVSRSMEVEAIYVGGLLLRAPDAAAS